MAAMQYQQNLHHNMTNKKTTLSFMVRIARTAQKMLLAAALIIFTLTACKKTELSPTDGVQASPPTDNKAPSIDFSNPIFVQNRPNPDEPLKPYAEAARNPLADGDYSDELPVILGQQLQNPYTRDNMATAYNVLYGTQYTAADIPITHYYIKFTPADNDQLAKMDEETELDLYTHPLDYELLQDGDYYAAPGKDPNDIPELYTVVAADELIPSFAPHTVLAALHIPPGDNLVLEEIAESQAASAVYYRTVDSGATYLNRSDVTGIEPLRMPECYNEGANPNPLDSNPTYDDYSCGGGGGGTGGGGIGNPAARPCGDAPLSCTDNRRPRGRIRYWDTQLGGTGSCVPLPTVKVIGKNWFKGVARANHMYTNASGEFVHNLTFKRVKVNVHFRNAGISIRPLRIAKWLRLSIFTLKSRLGNFRNCDMNTIDQVYMRPANKKSRGMEYWTASHVLHGFAEYKAQSDADQMKTFGGWRMKYYIQRDDIARTRGAASQLYLKSYFHNQQGPVDITISVVKIAGYTAKAIAGDVLSAIPASMELLRQVLGSQQPDIVLQYNSYPGDAENSLENMSSSELYKEIYSSYVRVSLMIYSKSESVKAYFKRGDKYIQSAISAVGTIVGILDAGSLYKYIQKFEEAFTSNPFYLTTVATQAAGVYTWITTLQAGLNNGAEEFFEVANGFGEYYGHKLCDRKYGLFADAFFNEKRQLVSSGSGSSSHYKYLEDWDPDVPVDETKMYRIGFFNDLDDNLEDIVENLSNISLNRTDFVSGIKPKDIFKCIIDDEGISPHAISWAQFKLNLTTKFPAQANQINQLCIPYRIP
jgi:hypothetical protein